MTSATDHAKTLLAAIIPSRKDLLEVALRHLTPGHFPDRVYSQLFRMLERYVEVTGTVLRADALRDMLHAARADAGTAALYRETYDQLANAEVDEGSFRWSLQQLRELAAERATGEALTQAMEILTRGTQNERGDLLRGHQDARGHVLTRFAEIDRNLTMQDAPEGEMRAEGNEILADYTTREAARLAGQNLGISFGIPALDAKINGLQRGELVLAAGYTSEGKSSLSVQLAWNAVVSQGRNVVILTTETIRTQVRRRIIARHSCLEAFRLTNGLNSRDIKNGTLKPEEKLALQRVVADFTGNPGYGRCYIIQIPNGATVGYLESKLTRVARDFPIDLVIMDYLALLRPDRKRNSDREELSGILKQAKQLAVTFADGAGIPFVSPWQVSRTARQEAERTGGNYNASALSETAEAPNSADIIVSLLAPLDCDSRIAKLRMQLMKNRDGERANAIEVNVDYATSRFGVQLPGSGGLDEAFGLGPSPGRR